MKRLIILGTGGNAVDILDTIGDLNQHAGQPLYDCVGFLDDNRELWGKTCQGVPILGALGRAREYSECCFVNGIGSPSNFWRKESIIAETRVSAERFATIVHPSASVSRTAVLAPGAVILQHVTVASNVAIGRHVIVLPNSVISHDDVVGDYTCIAGGVCISGGVVVGNSCYLGTNAAIISNVKIGNGCLIGMGSIVIDSVQDNSVVAGNPAKWLRALVADRPIQGLVPSD